MRVITKNSEMPSLDFIILISFSYALLLFVVAFWAERASTTGRVAWIASPWVYTLSLSVYCTGWTLYGAVGYAARSGLEYITIYLGPTLVMIGWWWILRHLVIVGRRQRVTSIADLISSRYGKSNILGMVVTALCVVSVTPYIALQLQSITLSLSVFYSADESINTQQHMTALWVAIGLAAFTILFGTRKLDANERHHGVVVAVALEAVVKLVALLAVGAFVVWEISGGIGETLARIDSSKLAEWRPDTGRWIAITMVSAASIICLPRMFQMMVVENEDEEHLRIAAWSFPLYLCLISLFVIPIAVVGLDVLPSGSNPDLFVLSLPLSQGQNGLAVIAFLGGFSAATSMVIVSAIALAIMISNHAVLPLYLSRRNDRAAISGDVRRIVLFARRTSIGVILGLGYFYYRLSGGGTALASIGLIAFVGIAQIFPSLIGGLFWRGATRAGALTGLLVGFSVWAWTLLLPGIGFDGLISVSVLNDGPWGLEWLRPQALFGLVDFDPITHAVLLSLSLNSFAFVGISLATVPKPMEQLQAAQFIDFPSNTIRQKDWVGSIANSENLMIMSQRILGSDQARAFFQREAERQGDTGDIPTPTPSFIHELERELAGSVGGATAHAMVGRALDGAMLSVEDLLAVADESARILEYSSALEIKSAELEKTANQLREANAKLTELSLQKDNFLSQISHELRTPMTSIRTFSEILRDEKNLNAAEKKRYADIINEESLRLTRLLDDLLNLSVLESGQVTLNIRDGQLKETLDRAVRAALIGPESSIAVRRSLESERVTLRSDHDRLAQVFINMIENARKYCNAPEPELTIQVDDTKRDLIIEFCDNGQGVPDSVRPTMFEKFARVNTNETGGVGLGLPICREIMTRLGGEIRYLHRETGGIFQIVHPKAVGLSKN